MGLDMYLRGEKFFWTDWEHPEDSRKEDGLRVSLLEVELGYWRKHPNLHGFIVKEFAEGLDECQRIELCDTDIERIIGAVQRADLPETKGFFFGESSMNEAERANDVEHLKRALDWVRVKEDGVSRSVIYRASW